MARRITEVLSVIWAHPYASCVVLLLFTPPLFPIVVYFSPLLIFTALCVLALIRVGPHVAATGDEAETLLKRLRVESLNISPWEAGLTTVRERANKKLRRSMEEMTWAEWMRGHEGWGRSPIEKQLREEAFSTDLVSGENDSEWMHDAKSAVAIPGSFGASGDIIADMAAEISPIAVKNEEMSKRDRGVIGEQGSGQTGDSCASLEAREQRAEQGASGRKEQELNAEGMFGRATLSTLDLKADEETCGVEKLQSMAEGIWKANGKLERKVDDEVNF